MAKPLYGLLRKDAKFKFGVEELKAFDKLKSRLMVAPILSIYNPNQLAIMYAIRRFRVYLRGIKFKIITDCNSLTMALKKRDVNP